MPGSGAVSPNDLRLGWIVLVHRALAKLALEHNRRFDGRGLLNSRPLQLQVPSPGAIRSKHNGRCAAKAGASSTAGRCSCRWPPRAITSGQIRHVWQKNGRHPWDPRVRHGWACWVASECNKF